LPKALDSNPNLKQGVFRTSSKWISGQKIRVKFLDGDEFVKSKVKIYAQVWEQFANIDFVFVESGTADIRVSFEPEKGASWSLVGKSSQIWSIRRKGNSTETYQGSDGVSMNFGWFDRKGMKFLLDFNINKAKGEEHILAIYFYTPDGKVLKDTNNSYRAKDGSVSAWRTFKPNFDRTVYTDFAVFLPYSELDLPCGEYHLKYVIYAWQAATKIANSGYSYFT
jgi:hypothetical protein